MQFQSIYSNLCTLLISPLMFETLGAFAIIILISIIFRWFFSSKTQAILESIHTVVFNVTLPAMCIKTFATASLEHALIYEIISAWLITLATLAVGLIAVRVLKTFHPTVPSRDLGVLVLITGFGNVLYLGSPVITGLYGKEAFIYAVSYDFFATTLIILTVGSFIACKYGQNKGFDLKTSLQNIIKLMPLWGILVGLCINLAGIKLNDTILKSLTMLAETVTPLMMFCIGLSLKVSSLKSAKVLLPFLIIKLFVSPLIAYWITGLLPMTELVRKTVIMQSAMPVMVLVAVITARFKLNESLTALAITISTAISFITLPLTASILEAKIK